MNTGNRAGPVKGMPTIGEVKNAGAQSFVVATMGWGFVERNGVVFCTKQLLVRSTIY